MLSRRTLLVASAALPLAMAAQKVCDGQNATGHVDHLNDELFGPDGVETGRIVIASILCWLITSVAVAAGIGGGGLLVPLYYIALAVPQTQAVSLSKGTIFGVAVGNFFFISRESHPKADRPLIDYPTAVFMQGGELMGVVVGVLLNLLLPEIVTIILSAVVLGFNAYKTLQKARVKRAAETKAMNAKRDAAAPVAAQADEPKANGANGDANGDANGKAEGAAVAQVEVEVSPDPGSKAAILKQQAVRFPLWAWSLLLLMVSFFIVYSLLVASIFHSSSDPLDNCNPGYWPAYVTPFIFYGIINIYMAKRNMQKHREMVAAGVEPVEGDILWTPRAAYLLVPAAIGAGVAAGLLGIGGGMILGPIFVALNFQPQVGTATTGFMILFTALGGTIKYLTVGKLPWRHFLWFGSIGCIGGQTGQRVVKRIIQKTGRPSYVVFILGTIIALAVIIMTTFGIVRVVEEINCGIDVWMPELDQFVCRVPEVI